MQNTIQLNIEGMSCTSCVSHIEKSLTKLNGVLNASINFAMEKGVVTFNPAKTDSKRIIATIKQNGYNAKPVDTIGTTSPVDEKVTTDSNNKTLFALNANHLRLIDLSIASTLTIIILSLGFAGNISYKMEIMMVLSSIILFYSGREFLQKGIPALIKGHPGMDSLVLLGVGAAFLYSTYITLFVKTHEEYFMDVAVIITFILLGRYLEAKAKSKAGDAISKLASLSAKVAHRLKTDGSTDGSTDNSTEDIPINQVKKGDLLKILPGEKIPVDGIITEGIADINESMVTGESIPVDKQNGDSVIGATINGNRSFIMQAQKIGSETMLAQITKMVQQAQMSKATIQKLTDIISGYFVWGIIVFATITFLTWLLIINVEPATALIYAVSVLVIACPCALGLATPISITTATGKGAQMGILIKKTESLEKVHKITAIAFDKTGTITKGEPQVQKFKILDSSPKDTELNDTKLNNTNTILNIALALELNSEHPLAKSVVQFARKQNSITPPKVDDFEAITGLGVTGLIKDQRYHLGSSRYINQLHPINSTIQTQLNQWQEQGYTVLVLATNTHIIALFGIQDGIKETSEKAVKLLKKQNIHTIMITGDNDQVARKIAHDVAIDEVHSNATPEQKKAIIANLQQQGHFVAMVGDGINDSPALTQADIGIAMGTGTDIAMETGDLVLVKGDLLKAVDAIALSRATLTNIKQNLFWAFSYNSIGIPLAATGFLSPTFSAIAMAFSSISVVLNSLRLKRFKMP